MRNLTNKELSWWINQMTETVENYTGNSYGAGYKDGFIHALNLVNERLNVEEE